MNMQIRVVPVIDYQWSDFFSRLCVFPNRSIGLTQRGERGDKMLVEHPQYCMSELQSQSHRTALVDLAEG